jgi:PIN domain nuclease of toxin-antitoxin system
VRLLLDTHVLLWSLGSPAQLRADARDAIEDGGNEVLVSAASAWEIAIKRALGRLEAPDDLPSAMEAAAFVPLSITIPHALAAGALPPHHRDPFDRMLVAQATLEELTVVTRDPHFARYGVPTLPA